jgi:hypothetical protein
MDAGFSSLLVLASEKIDEFSEIVINFAFTNNQNLDNSNFCFL